MTWNSLFFMTGPPAEKPKLLRSKTDLGTPKALFWKEFDEKGNLVKTYVFKAGILVEPK